MDSDIFDSLRAYRKSSKVELRRINYSSFKTDKDFDFIFMDTCKCLDTPKEDIKRLKFKYKQFLKENGKLISWFDGI